MTKNILMGFLIIFAIGCFCFLIFGIDALSDDLNGISYLSIGDSIAAGYALPNYKKDLTVVKDSFASKFGNEIGATSIDNLAVSGSTTEDTIKSFDNDKYKNLIKKADVITIAIGSNDLLTPGLDIVYETVGVKNSKEMQEKLNSENQSKIETIFLVDEISKAIKTKSAQKRLDECVEKYKENFQQIIKNIRKLNQNATIIVESYYNPFKDFVYENAGVKLIDFGDSVQKYIDQMNDFLKDNKYYNKEYVLADISDIESKKTNVLVDLNLMRFDVDPHPNEDGHDYIYKKTLSAYKKKNG